jgi:putative ABC transport system substrate-binding protein
VAGLGEVKAAAHELAARRVGALLRVGDYATSRAFPALAAVGLRRRLPVYSVDPTDLATPGCLAVVGWDAAADGGLAGDLAVKVLRGRSPASLPFEPVTHRLLLLNQRTAKAIGVRFPASLEARADGSVG